VLASFADRQLSSVTGSSLKITCYAARLGDEHLGLDSATYQELVIKVTDIIHAAWAVNFVGGLRSFEADHIRGMYNLIRLATKATGTLPVRFYFCSSGASVLGQPPSSPIMERISDDPASAFKLGYAQSKWVAEGICAAAWRGPLKGRVGVLRVGQLCGDTQHGLWNENEGWPLMLRTVDDVGALPKLDQDVFWLPVDTAAVAILDIVLSSRRSSRLENDECQVLHVMNPNPTSWNDISTWLREYGKKFESMIPTEWVKAVAASEPDAEKNPSRKLLGLWMSAVSTHSPPLAPYTDAP
jgi:thioester reductase-like protein